MVSVTALAVPLGAEQQLQSHSWRAKIPFVQNYRTLGSINPPTGASSTPHHTRVVMAELSYQD